jgi:hypothetical protein
MPNQAFEVYANSPDLVVLCGTAALALTGVCLLLRRILVSAQRGRAGTDASPSEGGSDPDEDRWDWVPEHPFSQAAVPASTAALDVQPEHAEHGRPGMRIEYFDPLSEFYEDSSGQNEAFVSTANTSQPGQPSMSVGEIPGRVYRLVAAGLGAVMGGLSRVRLLLGERGERIWAAPLERLPHRASLQGIPHFDYPAQHIAKAGGLGRDLILGTPSGERGRRPFDLARRLGIATMCMVVALGYASNSRQAADIPFSASPDQADQASREVPGAVDPVATASLGSDGSPAPDRTRLESPSLDVAAVRAKVEAAKATAAKELADREHREVETERARSAALQQALLESRRQTDALRTSMAAADKAREGRLRNELAAARTLDALRHVAEGARTLLSETASYMVAVKPTAHLERQRADWLAHDLSRARERIEQLEAVDGQGRNRAEASLAHATAAPSEKRRKTVRLSADLAKAEASNAALASRAKAAEQERAGAVSAQERAEQIVEGSQRALADERAAADSTGEDLDRERHERDAAAQGQASAVSAKERAEQAAKALKQALARERIAAASTHDDLSRTRLERDAARANLAEVTSRLQQALDTQREDIVALARNLVAARDDNDRLRAEHRTAEIEPPAKLPSARATAGTGPVKPVSLKTSRSGIRKQSGESSRRFTLPYSLLPRRPALEQ